MDQIFWKNTGREKVDKRISKQPLELCNSKWCNIDKIIELERDCIFIAERVLQDEL